ncbi:MAG: DUF1003 domain-containing protein [Parcubacteria group bacterium]|nr:DUF1003 domain-containing protein [Parcubacteria group bacterium]
MLKRLAFGATQWVGTPLSILIHTLFFVGIFGLRFIGIGIDSILLILTTLVSLEAIYLAIFIQMTVNRSMESLAEVEDDIESIEEEVKELGDDVEDISEDVKGLEKDMDKIQEDDDDDESATKMTLEKIEAGLQKLLADIEHLKSKQ